MQFFHSRCAVALLLVAAALSSHALSQIGQPISPVPANPDRLASLEDARKLIAQGQFKDADASLRRDISANSSGAEAYYLLAYVLLRENLPKQSLAEYTAAARLRTPSAEDLRNVALDYVLLNDYPDAEKWTLRSLTMDRNNPEIWYSLGRIRYSTGKFEDAVECFEHALALDPRSVKAENNLGLAYEGLNRLQLAKHAYQTAIYMQKDAPSPSPQPLINLAILLLHRSELSGALALLRQAVAIAPDDQRAHEQMGHVYLQQNQLANAQAEFEKAVSLSPQDPRLHFLLGQVYRREGMTQKAQTEFALTASLNGTHSTPR